MRGARALGFATLLLAGVVAAPALSAAEDPAARGQTTAPVPDPGAPREPLPPGEDPDPIAEAGVETQAPPAGAAASASAPQRLAVTEASESREARVAASASVSVGDNFYSPATVTIKAGDTVSWRNNGQSPHSATADDGSFDTGVFGPGQSRSHTFNQAGTFSYFCTVHGQAQSGTVRVEAAGAGGGGGGGGGRGDTGGATVPGPSEAAATAAPNAAGNSSFLPATGFGALGLAAVGLTLLAAGTLLERRQGAR